jgi:KipI family sensor histidine kinase inhibitor
VQFRPASDRSLLVYVGTEIGHAAHEDVLRLLRTVEAARPAWLRNLQPAYCSLLIDFDPAQVTHEEVETTVNSLAKSTREISLMPSKAIEIPVSYGGEFGPDLEEASSLLSFPAERIIELHAATTYRAYFLGFAPGFAYLGDLPAQLQLSRLAAPRKQVPPGSVAIAGKQTAVYPFATPGGWRLIGRTPLAMFRLNREPMSLIGIGDRVRFRPITREAFLRLERA